MCTAFACNKCGTCCRHLRLFGKSYTWLLDGDTDMCRYFDPDSNLCTIYPIRPLICNIEIGYHVYFPHISYEDFITMNKDACIQLKKKFL